MPAVKREAGRRGDKGRGPSRRGRAQAGGRFGGLSARVVLAGAAVVLAGGVGLMLGTGGRAEAIEAALGSQFAGAGFKVASVQVSGASSFSIPYIQRAAAVEPGQPMLAIDLDQVRERVERVGWVKSVRVIRLLPDTLVISVSERPRLAVWQDNGRAQVIDPDGQVIPEADPSLFADLPLVVGEGANEAAGEILPMLQSRPRLMSRVDALVRVDGRRWDLRMKDGGVIQLPASGDDSALIRLDQLDAKGRILDLGFERIDLRDPDMTAVRPREPAGPVKAAQPATSSSAGAPNSASKT